MISFIAIGKNEGMGIVRCLESIKAVAATFDVETEVIYVDSASTDNSTQLASNVDNVSVYVLTADNNAAIARNVGAQMAKGQILFFIDGDMELLPSCLALFDDNYNLKNDFISGNFLNYYYAPDGQLLNKEVYKKVKAQEDSIQYTTGGLFAIYKSLWDEMNGMNPMFVKGQDLDLGYRLAAKGHYLLRKKEVIANHHTIDYKHNYRLWRSFKDKTIFLPRAVLYRTHWNNKFVLKRMLTSDPTFLFLIVSLLALAGGFYWLLPAYVTLVALAVSYAHKPKGLLDFISRLTYQITRDISIIIAFIFYFPPHNNNIQFIKV